jgi:predicted glycogen debranching enzyme
VATQQFGPWLASDLEQSVRHEWLLADGTGGYAMGTVSGLRTRRYHGLLIAPDPISGRRYLGLAALDATVTIGTATVRLGTHEWANRAIDPNGTALLSSFAIIDGVPRWRWAINDVVIEREIAMAHGTSTVGVVYRVIRAPSTVDIRVGALVTWRDAHGERYGTDAPSLSSTDEGFSFDGVVHGRGPAFVPHGEWYRGVLYRVEAERGLNATEDLYSAGHFHSTVVVGETVSVEAWVSATAGLSVPSAEMMVDAARKRACDVAVRAGAVDECEELLAHAADQFIVSTAAGPDVIAGYPWFGSWSRDTLTSYEGLFLLTGRFSEGAALLERLAITVSEGMLANTADTDVVEYNTVDAALWFLHAVDRHLAATSDLDLAARLEPAMSAIVEGYLAGTRFGIGVDPSDGLVRQGEPGVALTWMDARIDGVAVTPRVGKPVEINALWINGLAALCHLRERLSLNVSMVSAHENRARESFLESFDTGGGLFDVVDGDEGGAHRSVRPNQLLAASLPYAPPLVERVVHASAALLTPLGLRSLSPSDENYRGRHQGPSQQRDRAYHQGTVWPWLIGPYIEAALKTGVPVDGVIDGLLAHLGEAGLGSVSETCDGDPPHRPTGCPFQAWSVAEVFRAKRMLAAVRQL